MKNLKLCSFKCRYVKRAYGFSSKPTTYWRVFGGEEVQRGEEGRFLFLAAVEGIINQGWSQLAINHCMCECVFVCHIPDLGVVVPERG